MEFVTLQGIAAADKRGSRGLRKVTNSRDWDGAASSARSVDGSSQGPRGVAFRPLGGPTLFFVGLASGAGARKPQLAGVRKPRSIDFSLEISEGRVLRVFELGTLVGEFGRYAVEDLLEVAFNPATSRVEYRVNGDVRYESLTSPEFPLHAKLCAAWPTPLLQEVLWIVGPPTSEEELGIARRGFEEVEAALASTARRNEDLENELANVSRVRDEAEGTLGAEASSADRAAHAAGQVRDLQLSEIRALREEVGARAAETVWGVQALRAAEGALAVEAAFRSEDLQRQSLRHVERMLQTQEIGVARAELTQARAGHHAEEATMNAELMALRAEVWQQTSAHSLAGQASAGLRAEVETLEGHLEDARARSCRQATGWSAELREHLSEAAWAGEQEAAEADHALLAENRQATWQRRNSEFVALREEEADLCRELSAASSRLRVESAARTQAAAATANVMREAQVAEAMRTRAQTLVGEIGDEEAEVGALRLRVADLERAEAARVSRPTVHVFDVNTDAADPSASARHICVECPGVTEEAVDIEPLPNGVFVRIALAPDQDADGQLHQQKPFFEQAFHYDFREDGHFKLQQEECCMRDGILRLVLQRERPQRIKLKSCGAAASRPLFA